MVIAKARAAQLIACPSSFAAAYLAVNRELGTPLFECAFVAVGLKFSSGIRREGQAPPLQVLKKAFLTWVGESLGAPVVNESGTVVEVGKTYTGVVKSLTSYGALWTSAAWTACATSAS